MRFSFFIPLLVLVAVMPSCHKKPGTDRQTEIQLSVDSRDVDRFYALLDSLEPEGKLTGQLLYNNYLKDGSPALKVLFQIEEENKPSRETLNKIVAKMNELLPFLKTNRERIKGRVWSTETANKLLNSINSAFGGQYNEILSDKIMYFSIGMGRQLGGAREYGIFLDVAMLNSDDMDFSEHPNGEFLSTFLPKDLEFLTAHEFVHVIQTNLPQDSNNFGFKDSKPIILQYALLEGGANYLTTLVSGEERYEEFTRQNSDHLKKDGKADSLLTEFLGDVEVQIPQNQQRPEQLTPEELAIENITKKWFYNFNDERKKDGIADLGYSMGYLIAKKYFEFNEEKESRATMVKTLLEANSTPDKARKFLEKSGL